MEAHCTYLSLIFLSMLDPLYEISVKGQDILFLLNFLSLLYFLNSAYKTLEIAQHAILN